jgi:preprotein translocase subunit SecD
LYFVQRSVLRARRRAQAEEDAAEESIPILLHKQIGLTSENLTEAFPGFNQDMRPAVFLRLDDVGSRKISELTRQGIDKHLAFVLFEEGKGKVVAAPVIRTVINSGMIQIDGGMNIAEAKTTASLLRTGALAAPMKIIEEHIVSPSRSGTD